MTFIKIKSYENGAHDNQLLPRETTVPDGWAVIPEGMKLPSSFPFVDIETEEQDGVPTVTRMTARNVPESTEAAADTVPAEAVGLGAHDGQEDKDNGR